MNRPSFSRPIVMSQPTDSSMNHIVMERKIKGTIWNTIEKRQIKEEIFSK